MQADLHDFTMFYDDYSAGRVILLIHGFPLNREMWAPQRELKSCRLLAPDLRGHGETPAVPGPCSIDLLADDCLALLDYVGIQTPVVVCGLSMGGYIALAFYRRHHARVAGLILAATRAGSDSPEARLNRDKFADLARREGPQAVVDQMLPRILAPQTYKSNPELVKRVERIMKRTSAEGMVAASLAMKERPDSRPWLAQIAVPTLIIHGEEDQFIPMTEAQAMQVAIHNARLVSIPVAGHLPNLENPARFNQEVQNFIASM